MSFGHGQPIFAGIGETPRGTPKEALVVKLTEAEIAYIETGALLELLFDPQLSANAFSAFCIFVSESHPSPYLSSDKLYIPITKDEYRRLSVGDSLQKILDRSVPRFSGVVLSKG
jgi:hypothetical protein